MKKLAAAIAVSSVISGNALAVDGEIMFRDSMFGVAIGGTAGLAVYMIDSKDLGKKIGAGVLLGLIGGIAVGFYESNTALVEIDGNQMKFGIPEIEVTQFEENKEIYTLTKVNLIGAKF